MNVLVQRLFKYNSIVVAAIFMTFLMFYFMQFLVAPDCNRQRTIDVIKLIDATVPEFKQELLLDILKPEPILDLTPPVIELPTYTSTLDGVPSMVTGWNITEPVILTTESIPLASNIMVPLIRTTANYPQRALARGIEGFVELSFTVNELGNVIDPIILRADPEGYFERSALQAITRWKYSAAVEDGDPVPTYDVRQRIVFQIEQ
ncbi:MAG TPA: hypothetical protein DCM64_11135 [Gammaproteobacteria bacterium]|jgi:protein TonB|nr:energy transducer TonB [Gammaproteobacteria bacterium]MDP6768064.1 energy transducer TonB [Arenicellales bacterium]HAJ76996.1 hypothetical protein [Gammaproteobacteria bacterium]|tara:strand:- start:2555 stop:3169 length:615 start_codon:yes stop_codon:yes gene_type:complete